MAQVDPEELVERLHNSHITAGGTHSLQKREHHSTHLTPYGSRYASQVDVPKYKIPQHGAHADTVYQMIKDELDLDGKPNLNLAR